METARAVLGKKGQKSNSAALSAKQLRVAAVGIHAYNFFTYRSVHLLELSVFFLWAEIHNAFICVSQQDCLGTARSL